MEGGNQHIRCDYFCRWCYGWAGKIPVRVVKVTKSPAINQLNCYAWIDNTLMCAGKVTIDFLPKNQFKYYGWTGTNLMDAGKTTRSPAQKTLKL